jgi:hypothetical protein
VKNGSRLQIAGLLAILLTTGSSVRASAYSFITLDDPAAPLGRTSVYGISGTTVVGTFSNSGGNPSGFTETGGVYTTLAEPNNTWAYGISGSSVVGTNLEGGFVETGGNYTTINPPNSRFTQCHAISGSLIVGYYQDTTTSTYRGFIESLGAFTLLDYPGATGGTYAMGISGNTVVGFYRAPTNAHGFMEIGGVYTPLDFPGASETYALGVSGSTVVGYYNASGRHGFIYANGIFTTIDDPLATQVTAVYGIDGNTIAGTYQDAAGSHGFTATPIPEPTSLALVGFASAVPLLQGRARRRHRGALLKAVALAEEGLS